MYKKREDQTAYQRQWRKNNRSRVAEIKRRYYKKHLVKKLIRNSKNGAKKRNILFDLKEEDIVLPSECPVFGTPFEYGSQWTASLDRIDSTEGYIKGNVQVISKKANTMKSDASPEELLKFAKWIFNEQKIHNATGPTRTP